MINKRTSILSIFGTIVVIGLLVFQLPKLKFDYELEKFFPQSDPDLAYYQQFSKYFGHDNDFLLLGFTAPDQVFDSAFLNEVDRTLSRVSALEGTRKIVSPTNVKTVIKTPMGLLPIPLIHLDQKHKLQKDSANLYAHPLYREMFISRSGRHLKVVVFHQRFPTKVLADTYVDEVRHVMASARFPAVLAGKAIAQSAFVNAVKDDFALFIFIAAFLIFAWLLLFMRNLVMILTTLLITGLSVIATVGIMAVTGKEVDVLSSLIPTILLVVSLSNIIHLFSHIQQECKQQVPLTKAVNQAVRQVGLATLLTSFTTAIGFLTLVTINVVPIIDMGIYAAAGIAVAFLITYALFPTVLVLGQPPISKGPSFQPLIDLTTHLFLVVIRKRILIASISAAVFLLTLIGISKIEIDAYLINDLPTDDPIKADFLFFDQNFSGTKPFSISIWLKDSTKSCYDPDIIDQIDLIERLARTEAGAGDLISPVTFVKFANQALHNGLPAHYALPDNDRDWRKAQKILKDMHAERKLLKVTEGRQAQISGFFQDHGSHDGTIKQAKLKKALAEQVDFSLIGCKQTGTSLLIDKSHESLSHNLVKGLLVAMCIVGIIAGLMFRSWRMVIITLIPNLIPILFVAAIMGYFHIPLNLSTSVIFAISFGIVVDDTIHFLSRFKQEYQNGKDSLYATKRTMISTGQPIVITTIMLSTGFLVFCLSSFSATFYTGLFVSISFMVALIADITLLPVLILWWLPKRNPKM